MAKLIQEIEDLCKMYKVDDESKIHFYNLYRANRFVADEIHEICTHAKQNPKESKQIHTDCYLLKHGSLSLVYRSDEEIFEILSISKTFVAK